MATRFERDSDPAGPVVSGFAGGGFRIDGEVFAAALLTPKAALRWDAPAIEALDEAALAPLLKLDPPPEFLLLGTGARLVHPPRALVAGLAA
ncbi:MAG: Mth938-like domain-containing protein, partial [Sphingomonadaceae bacterium]|nr:Mth938-like domain-containing protein [Sphingomonadaceae bacterium]